MLRAIDDCARNIGSGPASSETAVYTDHFDQHPRRKDPRHERGFSRTSQPPLSSRLTWGRSPPEASPRSPSAPRSAACRAYCKTCRPDARPSRWWARRPSGRPSGPCRRPPIRSRRAVLIFTTRRSARSAVSRASRRPADLIGRGEVSDGGTSSRLDSDACDRPQSALRTASMGWPRGLPRG